MPITQAKEEALRKKIKLQEIKINTNVKDHLAHYEKAKALLELGRGLEDKSYFSTALRFYDEAIRLTESQEALYLSARAKLLAEIGQPELAVEDMQKIHKLPITAGVHGLQIDNTMRQVAKLDTIQGTVNKLCDSGKIDPELATALNAHAKITQSLVVQVDEHGNKLEDHDDRIALLEGAIATLEADKKITDEVLRQLGIQVKEHQHIMEALDLKSQAELIEGVKGLERSSPEAYEYYGKFYWTLMHVFEASGVINSGLVQSKNSGKFAGSSKHGQLLDAGLKKAGAKVVEYTTAMTSSIPLIGSVIKVLSLVVGNTYNSYKDMKFSSAINTMNRVITNKFNNSVPREVRKKSVGENPTYAKVNHQHKSDYCIAGGD